MHSVLNHLMQNLDDSSVLYLELWQFFDSIKGVEVFPVGVFSTNLFEAHFSKWNCNVCVLMYTCRCRKSVEFSVRTAWLIGAYAADVNKPRWKTSQGVKLRKMILHEELRSVNAGRFQSSISEISHLFSIRCALKCR